MSPRGGVLRRREGRGTTSGKDGPGAGPARSLGGPSSAVQLAPYRTRPLLSGERDLLLHITATSRHLDPSAAPKAPRNHIHHIATAALTAHVTIPDVTAAGRVTAVGPAAVTTRARRRRSLMQSASLCCVTAAHVGVYVYVFPARLRAAHTDKYGKGECYIGEAVRRALACPRHSCQSAVARHHPRQAGQSSIYGCSSDIIIPPPSPLPFSFHQKRGL